MIEIEDYKSWVNKIILAPNGSGKTRLSKKLYNRSKNGKTKLFSTSTINDFINIGNTGLIVGEASKYIKSNENILLIIKNSKFFEKIAKEIYNSTSAKSLRDNSFTFSLLNVKNTNSVDFFLSLINFNNINNYIYDSNFFELDKKIDIYLYNDVLDILNNIDKYNNINDNDVDSIYVTHDIKNKVKDLKDYMEQQRLFSCLLCGYSNSDLKENIHNNINRLTTDPNYSQFFNNVYNRFILQTLSDEKKLFDDKISQFRDFVVECNAVKDNILSYFYNYSIDSNNLSYYIKLYNDNSKYIKSLEKNTDSQNKFEQIVMDEIKRILTLPNEVNIKFKDNILTFESDESDNPLEILSDSEIKRLGLVVLKAEIECSVIDYVILDDPLDSCDDYYLTIASSYIADIMNNSSIKFTLFTHLYEFCYYLANFLKNTSSRNFDFTYYYYDYNYLYDGLNNNCKLIHHILTKCQIININKNELFLLSFLLNQKGYDKTFVLLSMAATLRNLILDINLNVQNLPNLFKSYGFSETYNDQFYDDIRTKMNDIESNYLHVGNKIIALSDFTYIINKLFNVSINDLPSDKSCINLRTDILSQKFNDGNRGIIVMLFKMLRVQNCKYEMEKKLYNILSELKVKEDVIENIRTTNTLGGKIKKALSSINDNRLLTLYQLHDKYAFIINDYSHSTTRLFTPFLMTSIIDIAKLEYDVFNV